MELQTPRLKIVLQTREEVEQMLAALPDEHRALISPDWLAHMRAATPGDPWSFAFRVIHRETGADIGTCSFKGPPVNGVVEISYSTHPEHQHKGYATEAAKALVDFASSRREVHLIRAHTLPTGEVSKRILARCGFRYVGEAVDPEDGTVSRFERAVVELPRS
jgi:[ribosomal protein S5]-alanine N-acetyltransferase